MPPSTYVPPGWQRLGERRRTPWYRWVGQEVEKRWRSFWGLPLTDARLPRVAWQYFDYLVSEYELITSARRRTKIDQLSPAEQLAARRQEAVFPDADQLIRDVRERGGSSFATWDDLQTLARYLLEMTDDNDLPAVSLRVLQQFRTIATKAEFRRYLETLPRARRRILQLEIESEIEGEGNSPVSPPRVLRNELENLLGLIYWKYRVIRVREATRSLFMVHCAIFQLAYLIFLLIIAPSVAHAIHAGDPVFTRTTLLMVLILGTLGANTSIQYRIQSLPYHGDPVLRIMIFDAGKVSFYFGIVAGSIFALIGYFLFRSGAMQGFLFPDFTPKVKSTPQNWFERLFSRETLNIAPSEYAKLYVWSFIAGFAERFIPDTLNRFIEMKTASFSAPPPPDPRPGVGGGRQQNPPTAGGRQQSGLPTSPPSPPPPPPPPVVLAQVQGAGQ